MENTAEAPSSGFTQALLWICARRARHSAHPSPRTSTQARYVASIGSMRSSGRRSSINAYRAARLPLRCSSSACRQGSPSLYAASQPTYPNVGFCVIHPLRDTGHRITGREKERGQNVRRRKKTRLKTSLFRVVTARGSGRFNGLPRAAAAGVGWPPIPCQAHCLLLIKTAYMFFLAQDRRTASHHSRLHGESFHCRGSHAFREAGDDWAMALRSSHTTNAQNGRSTHFRTLAWPPWQSPVEASCRG